MISTPVLLTIAALSQATAPPVRDLDSAWEMGLKVALRGIAAPVAIDLPSDVEPPEFEFDVRRMSLQLEAFASIYERDATVLDGALALTRKEPISTPGASGDSVSLLASIARLSPGEVKQLATEGSYYQTLPPTMRTAVAQLSRSNPNLAENILQGAPVHIQLHQVPVAEYRDPATNRTRTLNLGTFDFYNEKNSANRKAAASQTASAVDLKLREGVDIDFGDGALLTLDEFSTKIRTDLAIGTSFDRRLANSKVFVKGKFTRRAAEEVLLKLSSPFPGKTFPWQRVSRVDVSDNALRALKAARDISEEDGAGSLSQNDLDAKATKSLEELATQSPYLRSQLESLGLGNDAQFKLGSRLGIAIHSPSPKSPKAGRSADGTLRFRIDP